MASSARGFSALAVVLAAACAAAAASGPKPGNPFGTIFPAPQVYASTLDDTRRPLHANVTVVQPLSSGDVFVASGLYDNGKTSVAAQVFPWDADAGRFAPPVAVYDSYSKSGNSAVSPLPAAGYFQPGFLGLFSAPAYEGELWAVTAGGTFGVFANTTTREFKSGIYQVALYTPSVIGTAAAINATHFAIVTTRGTSTLLPDSPLALGVFDTTKRNMVGPAGGFFLPAKAVVTAGSCGTMACLFFDEANSALVAVVPGTRINATLALPLLAGAKVEQVTVAFDAALERAVVHNWRTVYVVDVAATWGSISLHAAFGSHISGGVSVAKLLTRGSLAIGSEADQATSTKAALSIVNVSTGVVGPRVALAGTVGTPTDVRLITTVGAARRMVVVTTSATAEEASNGTASPANGVSATVDGERVMLGEAVWSATELAGGYAIRGVFTDDPVTGGEAVAVQGTTQSTGPLNQWAFVELAAGNVTYALQLGANASIAASADAPPFVLPAPVGATEATRLLVAPAARTSPTAGSHVFGWDAFAASSPSVLQAPEPYSYFTSTQATYVDPATGTAYWALSNTSISTGATAQPTFLASSAGLSATLPYSFQQGSVSALFLYTGTPFMLVYGTVNSNDQGAHVVIVDVRTGRTAWQRALAGNGPTWYFTLDASAFAIVPPASAASTAMELLRVTADGVTTVAISDWKTTDAALASPTALDRSSTRVLFANTKNLWTLDVSSASISATVAHTMKDSINAGVIVDDRTTMICAKGGAHVWTRDKAAGVNAVELRIEMPSCAGPMFTSKGRAYAFTATEPTVGVYGWYLARLDAESKTAALIRVGGTKNLTFNLPIDYLSVDTLSVQLFEAEQLVAVLHTDPTRPVGAMLDLVNGTNRWVKTQFPTRTSGIHVAASSRAADGQLLTYPRFTSRADFIGVTATDIYTGETSWQLPLATLAPSTLLLTLLAPPAAAAATAAADASPLLRHSGATVGSLRRHAGVTRVTQVTANAAGTDAQAQPGVVSLLGQIGTFRSLGISPVAAPSGFRPGDAPVFPASGDHTFAPATTGPSGTSPPYNPNDIAPVSTMSPGKIAGIALGSAAAAAIVFGGFALVMFIVQRRGARAHGGDSSGRYQQIDGPELRDSTNASAV